MMWHLKHQAYWQCGDLDCKPDGVLDGKWDNALDGKLAGKPDGALDDKSDGKDLFKVKEEKQNLEFLQPPSFFWSEKHY